VSDLRAELRAALLELGAQLAEVEDLAVEDDRDRAVGRVHRLVAVGRQVEDREAAVVEADAAQQRRAVRVGAALAHRLAHRDERRLAARGRGGRARRSR
jgi:hypothetical protein